ncbi:hypothetical protein B9Z19DRAFT_1063279 [Tuber borchii]|uniref:Uncharacterized protein n=1 Tax=Tuber borchii TaxID=42251 RepID=A0A2T6ZYY7_TUBBO|nr:hypothetical protein B9Z19DRAFT_1063279 [Tuber borchii]
MSSKIVYQTAGGPPEGTRIREALLDLFQEDAIKQGLDDPIDDQRKRAWLKFIVPQIERAYGFQVYTHTPERLDGALDRIKQFCATFHVDSNDIIEEILALY